MGLLLRAGQLLLGAAVAGAAIPSCYSAGGGMGPPNNTLYFPVGLAVSPDGQALYVANSDFDLQFSGGTLQSYNLQNLRDDAASLVSANLDAGAAGGIPFIMPVSRTCFDAGLAVAPAAGVPLGQ